MNDTERKEYEDVATALRLVLADCDYTQGNCRVNEMVGAVLSKSVLDIAHKALAALSGGDVSTKSA